MSGFAMTPLADRVGLLGMFRFGKQPTPPPATTAEPERLGYESATATAHSNKFLSSEVYGDHVRFPTLRMHFHDGGQGNQCYPVGPSWSGRRSAGRGKRWSNSGHRKLRRFKGGKSKPLKPNAAAA